MRALVLLSGGLDSTTCLALAAKRLGKGNVGAVSFLYGQKHAVEVQHAKKVAQHFCAKHVTIEVPDIFGSSDSALLIGRPSVPEVPYEALPEGTSPAYVPFRNGAFLSLAAGLALSEGAKDLYFGAHAEDAARWAYPDCTPEFIGSMASAIHIGSGFGLRLLSPLQWMTKAEVVQLGLSLAAPYALTISCYTGATPACGSCPTCRSRREAFLANGREDPIPYAISN